MDCQIQLLKQILLFSYNQFFVVSPMDSEISTLQDYNVLQLLADGGQSNVYLCSKDQKLFAIKLYTLQQTSLSSFKNESEILFKLRHKNVLQICQSIQSCCVRYTNNTQKERAIIVLNFAQKGDLSQYISISKGFPSSICKRIFRQLIEGLEYINKMGISHRDIKPQNVLINDNFDLKISDFGLSAQMRYHKILQTKVGTDGFQAPQIQQGQYNGQKVDIFSLGVTLFIIFAGQLPFTSTKKSNQLYKYIIKKDYKRFWQCHQRIKPQKFFPQQFKALINKMLSKEPNDRPQFQELRNNGWLNSQVATFQQTRVQMSKRYELILQSRPLSQNKI